MTGSKKWWQRLFRIKSDRQILVEVAHKPNIQDARNQLKRADRILEELQVLEGKK